MTSSVGTTNYTPFLHSSELGMAEAWPPVSYPPVSCPGVSNDKFEGQKYEIANYFPDGVTGKFVRMFVAIN